jgi:hypothetical protein
MLEYAEVHVTNKSSECIFSTVSINTCVPISTTIQIHSVHAQRPALPDSGWYRRQWAQPSIFRSLHDIQTSGGSLLYHKDLLAACCYLPSNWQTIITHAAADRATDDHEKPCALCNKLGIMLWQATNCILTGCTKGSWWRTLTITVLLVVRYSLLEDQLQ